METGQLDFILEIENALTAEQCEALIARFESDPRKGPGRIAKGVFPDVKDTTDLVLPFDAEMMASIRPALKLYHEQYPLLPKKLRASAFMIMRYLPGAQYTWHNDAASHRTMARQYVAIWYLNDVLEGGHTQFLYSGRAIKPVQGKLALFPAGWTHAHRGEAPVSGPKYIATTWLELEA